MHASGAGSWTIREDASRQILLALYLRDALAIETPLGLPRLRDVRAGEGLVLTPEEQEELDAQWERWWLTAIEPERHPSLVPLELVEEFGFDIALPIGGAELLRRAIVPFAAAAEEWTRTTHEQFSSRATEPHGSQYLAYAGLVAEHERTTGRRAHAFELNVEVLPLAERGAWWIGNSTVAVTDSLRNDATAYATALRPIISEIA
ncbi:zinc-binding alcohol dehydrogenase [Luethyella okanaganae]|uniref:Zinc-binding alcohol dehydrogenase n=1 Tax=Luethyella okanaganae TaxID=69372 RepID=A0ABW1VHA8_9MICO